MKTKLFFLAFLFLFELHSIAQNLVTNNGFETFNALPTGAGEWWKVSGWNNVNNQPVFAWPYASPDYLSTNGSGSAQLPNCIFGNVNPFSGNAVMGFVAYYNPGAADFREYISRPLSSPLIVGQTYTISFMMTNGNSNQYSGSGCNHIGVCLSSTPLTQLQHEPINVVPQFEISTDWWSTTWKLVSFTYTASTPFQHLTIGNFSNDINTTHTVFNPSATSTFGAYYFIDEVIVQASVPLPVELISFSGINENNVNHLDWTTASEINNDYFLVEKSQDGFSFDKIGSVNGNGNSTQISNYKFDDLHPNDQTNYYRLKQVDYNGDYKYSQIIALRNKGINFHCDPYLEMESGNYFVRCGQSKQFHAQILNTEGRRIKDFQIAGESENKIDLQELCSGMYILRIDDGERIQSFKLLKN